MPSRVAVARAVAIGADAIQIGLFPFFSEGLISPLNMALDVVVCGVLTWLVGWHFAFLPSFVIEDLPLLDLAPTWTIAIMIKTRNASRDREATVVSTSPEGPRPAGQVLLDLPKEKS